ncbi:hypothetical protein ACFY4C_28210 [Actinomadura viridis]|uniref:hypothetical protein n=1 Tax=Actinomadura viridis TaxID=58110 RepID=UPI0036B011D9
MSHGADAYRDAGTEREAGADAREAADPFRRLLATADSELAGTLRDGLRLLARALDQTALLRPDDPGAEAFAQVRGALHDMLGEGVPAPPPVAAGEHAAAGPPGGAAPLPDPVTELLDGFHADRAVREHLGDARRPADPARAWVAFNCALLRLPGPAARDWRGRAARAAAAAPGAPVALPALDQAEDLLLPRPDLGIRGIRTAVGAAPLPEVARALAPLPAADPAGPALAALASQALTVAGLDPDALYFESLTPRPRPLADPSALADYTRELLTRLRAYAAAMPEGPARALEALIALDEALCSVAHLPPATDPGSWWNGLAARSHELVFTLAGGLGGRARVREPARRFRDVRDLTEDDVPMVSRTHPGRVVRCLRLYAEIDGVARRGRVIYGVDR